MSNPKTTPRREEARPDNRPGRYRIDHPDTPMPLDVRAWQMWAVHPSDLHAMEFKSREAFFLRHLEAVNGENARLRESLKKLLDYSERNTCQHEDTHRGGFLWEICDVCGAKWADDMGGKTEWKDPPEWVAARAALAGEEKS